MRVRFWGTRGSIATPGPSTVRFGGNTSCVEVNTDEGHLFLLDCGTGARALGAALMERTPRPTTITILLGHTHWDHIQGFPFFAPLFDRGNQITVCGPEGSGRSLRDVLAGQMEFTYFPLELGQLPAAMTFREVGEGVHEIGGVRVVAQYLNHPTMTIGYRIEADGASVAYLCDHEPFSEIAWRDAPADGPGKSIVHQGDRHHARFMAGASLVIHDAQYTPEEYPSHKNWGHSTYEYAVGLAGASGVRKLVLTHHDPTHDDTAVAAIESNARAFAEKHAPGLEVQCAFEGLEITAALHGAGQNPSRSPLATPVPETPIAARILVVDDDLEMRALVRQVLTQSGHTLAEASTGEEGLYLAGSWHPDLILLDLVLPDTGGLEVLKILRSRPTTATVPVVVLTAMDGEGNTRAGFESGATDYLTKPFSLPQLAARVRACLTRTEGRDSLTD